ncbi:MAG: hypothetical protein RJQ03_01395, partial [Miltoncostaeaceae bacterium]
APEVFLTKAGMLVPDEPVDPDDVPEPAPGSVSAEEAIRTDPALSAAQREALLAVYRSFQTD